MDSGRGSGGGMRGSHGGKKMRKRKELDALVGGVGVKRNNGGTKRPGSGGISPQDQLLSESTGDEEYWNVVKNGSKGRRHYPGSSDKRSKGPCNSLLRLCTILLVMACVVATLTVMWLFIDVREQTTYLRNQLDRVAAGTEGFSEALQKCHSLSKQLQNNQTVIFSNIDVLSHRLTNVSNQVIVLQKQLSNLHDILNHTPQELMMQKDYGSLANSVASFGGQLQDLKATSGRLQDDHNNVMSLTDQMKKDISNLQKNMGSVQQSLQASLNMHGGDNILSKLDMIYQNISSINSTLYKKLEYVTEDQHKDHQTIVNLEETAANMTARLSTVQGQCSDLKTGLTGVEKGLVDVNSSVLKNKDSIESMKKLVDKSLWEPEIQRAAPDSHSITAATASPSIKTTQAPVVASASAKLENITVT